MVLEYSSYHTGDLKNIARDILMQCNESNVFAFTGNLGAGKTTMIKEMCKELGYTGQVTSPTFSLINEYATDTDLIIHMDLYRLKNTSEALDIGIEEYFYNDFYCFIEWPDVVFPLLHFVYYQITINVNDENVRKIDVCKSQENKEIP